MSRGKDIARDLLSDARTAALSGMRKAADDSFVDGFNEASHICVSILTTNIDDLLNKVKSGSNLTDREQFLLLSLTEMKSATERDLFDFRRV